ncbi:hypothetical protein HDE69_005373, partial [Pedobacter cryoconitis]|nr:hypothetical protein [Pedobacter cryoconitis]
MVHQIYRAGAILAEVHLTGSWKTRVMGEDLAQSTWVMSSFVE